MKFEANMRGVGLIPRICVRIRESMHWAAALTDWRPLVIPFPHRLKEVKQDVQVRSRAKVKASGLRSKP